MSPFLHISHTFGLNFVDEHEYVRLLMNMKNWSLYFKVALLHVLTIIAEHVSGAERWEFPLPRSRGCSLHRSKSQQTAPLISAPRSPTISSRSGEIASRSLKFKIPPHA